MRHSRHCGWRVASAAVAPPVRNSTRQFLVERINCVLENSPSFRYA